MENENHPQVSPNTAKETRITAAAVAAPVKEDVAPAMPSSAAKPEASVAPTTPTTAAVATATGTGASADGAAAHKSNGWAPIKAEFIRSKEEMQAAAEAAKLKDADAGASAGDSAETGTPSEDRNGSSNGKDKGGDWGGGKKGKRGRNKKRPKDDRPAQADTLCQHLSDGRPCTYGERCRFAHDVKAYLEKKPPDIAETCPIWDARGSCPSGLKCRFGGAHTDLETLKPVVREGAPAPSSFNYINDLSRDLQGKLRRNQVPFACDRKGWPAFLASLDKDYAPQASQQPPSSDAPTAAAAATGVTGDGQPATAAPATAVPAAGTGATDEGGAGMDIEGSCGGDGDGGGGGGSPPAAKRAKVEATAADAAAGAPAAAAAAAAAADGVGGDLETAGAAASASTSTPTVAAPAGGASADGKDKAEGRGEGEWVRSCLERAEPRAQKRTVDFEGKVYIAPLTTVGNLPFRFVPYGNYDVRHPSSVSRRAARWT